jgi:hypothetical protein
MLLKYILKHKGHKKYKFKYNCYENSKKAINNFFKSEVHFYIRNCLFYVTLFIAKVQSSNHVMSHDGSTIFYGKNTDDVTPEPEEVARPKCH